MTVKTTVELHYTEEEQKAIDIVNQLILELCNESCMCEDCPFAGYCCKGENDTMQRMFMAMFNGA